MQHTIYFQKNGLVIKYDWQVITVGAVIFSILYIFSLVYLYYLHLCQTYIKYFGKGSQIRPLWSFDPILEPSIYMMVNGEYAHCYLYMLVSKLFLLLCGSEINQKLKTSASSSFASHSLPCMYLVMFRSNLLPFPFHRPNNVV